MARRLERARIPHLGYKKELIDLKLNKVKIKTITADEVDKTLIGSYLFNTGSVLVVKTCFCNLFFSCIGGGYTYTATIALSLPFRLVESKL